MKDKQNARLESLKCTAEVKARIREWLEYDEDTYAELIDLLEHEQYDELYDRFSQNLEFGTGGLRAQLGAGTNRMNRYTVLRVAHGLGQYLCKYFAGSPKTLVIGYDSRRYSRDFAYTMAAVCSEYGACVMLSETECPTPLVSFAVSFLCASMGVMITASHNPPEYNGIKVFGEYGGQIVAPYDQELKEIIECAPVYAPKIIAPVNYLNGEVYEAYYRAVLETQVHPSLVRSVGASLRVAYTALHGVGSKFVQRVLCDAGCENVFVVDVQDSPNKDFPTLTTLNPEDPEAWTLVLQRARETHSDLILVTDPDADRLGVGVKDKESYHILSGNQLGILLCYFILSQLHERDALPRYSFVVKTIVSSDLVRCICADFQVELVEVLTGFKYIAEQIFLASTSTQQKHFLFAFEESYGYNACSAVREKDGVGICLLVVELWAWCTTQSLTILEYLHHIYHCYGYCEEFSRAFFCDSSKKELLFSIMTHFRANIPRTLCEYSLIAYTDYLSQQHTDLRSHTTKPLTLPKSDVLMFEFEQNIKIVIRPSGTEAKLKCYFSCFEKDDSVSLEDLQLRVKTRLDIVAKAFCTHIEFQKNCLERRKDV